MSEAPEIPVRLVLTNCPNDAVARQIATAAVEQGLAACVSVLAPCRSVYVWNGRLCDDAEVPLLIKTTAERYAALEALIRRLHPYALPEIVAVPVVAGLAAYLGWVVGQTGGAPGAGTLDGVVNAAITAQ